MRAIARRSVEKLLVVHEHEAYCQPCVSPIWDTSLACHALLEVGGDRAVAQARKGLDWLVPQQILDVNGDWTARRPGLRPGRLGIPICQSALSGRRRYGRGGHGHGPGAASRRRRPISVCRSARAREWILGMQSGNGGWGAFDADNEYYYLNNIPFADHGALLDPPTEDVTARCVSMLAQIGDADSDQVARALSYLRSTQLADGSWYGRWGMNYIYGTWSVLCALNAAGVDSAAPEIRKAVAWLVTIQNSDGGWGEDGTSYKLDYRGTSRRRAPPRRLRGRCSG